MARLVIENPNLEKYHDEMMGLLAEKEGGHEALFLDPLISICSAADKSIP